MLNTRQKQAKNMLERSTVTLEMASDATRSFQVENRSYSQQFSQLYFQRLATFKPVLFERIKSKWPSKPLMPRVLDVNLNEECIIIGTVYVDSPMKPNILNEIASEVC
jgi:DNA polymerase delta subunit 2